MFSIRTGARAGEEDARVLVADRRQEVAQRGVVEAAAGDVGEVAARGGMLPRAARRRCSSSSMTVSIGMPCSEIGASSRPRPLSSVSSYALRLSMLRRNRSDRGDDGVAQPLPASGAGIERPGGPLEPADAVDQVVGSRLPCHFSSRPPSAGSRRGRVVRKSRVDSRR